MEITFEKDYLRELFYEGVASDKHHRYQPDIVKRYVRVESVRVNNQYRLEFKSSEVSGITICNIIELSNHYH